MNPGCQKSRLRHPEHFVETDNAIDRLAGQIAPNPNRELFVAAVIAHGLCRHEDDLESGTPMQHGEKSAGLAEWIISKKNKG
jgi:hypothetical protein